MALMRRIRNGFRSLGRRFRGRRSGGRRYRSRRFRSRGRWRSRTKIRYRSFRRPLMFGLMPLLVLGVAAYFLVPAFKKWVDKLIKRK